MTATVGTTSVDGTPISQADVARIQAEEALHAEQQRRAARVVAAAATDIDDCRMLLSILGLDSAVVAAARAQVAVSDAPSAATTGKRPRRRRAAA